MTHNEATFQIIGNIGQMRRVGNALKVSIAVNSSFKRDDGTWENRTYWNEVTVFNKLADIIEDKRNIGDLVLVRGVMHDTSYEKEFETIYRTERNVREFFPLAEKE